MSQREVLDKLGIASLSPMQLEAARAIGGGRGDVVVLSPTGSGKTLAYLLPLLELLQADSETVQALVVVPGRELALQSANVMKSMGSGLRAAACYGGRTAMDEHRRLRELKPQVVFGTPGRLNDHLQKHNIDPYGVRFLIIDEFDKCLEMGFHDEMARLVDALPGVRRRVLLSATEADAIPDFVNLVDAERIDYLTEEQPERTTFYEVRSPQKDKLDTLLGLLSQLGQTQSIVFLNYRDSVERVDAFLRSQGLVTSAFHGGLEQRQREDALYKFSNGSATVLVCTDLASRGLDIPDVANVIHYHLPVNEDGYIHRVGRTARWDREGKAYFLVGPDEHLPEFLPAMEQLAISNTGSIPQPRMATIYIGKGKKDKLSKGDILGFLCKKGGLASADIGRIDVSERFAYAAVSREKLGALLRQTKGEKIKGLKTVIEPVK